MTVDEKRLFLQCLFTIAWVDGSIAPMENALLATLFNHVALPADERETISAWFDAAPPEPDWAQVEAMPELRTTLLEQVYLVAASDGRVEAGEVGLLERLRTRLGVDDAEFEAIARKIEKIVSG